MIVYKATSPNGKVYVGITTRTLEVRRSEHYNDATSNRYNMPIHHAIKKYGNDIIWEVIDTAISAEELKSKEIAWIEKLGSANNGYNVSLGGEMNNIPRTQKWADNIAKALGTDPFEVYTLDGSLVGKWINASECARTLHISESVISACLRGEYRKAKEFVFVKDNENLSDKLDALKTYWKPGTQDNMALAHGGKPFQAIKIDTGEIVGTWTSRPICAKILGVGTSSIARILNQPEKYPNIKGYTFKFID